jgi:hypothetical protein
MSAGFCLQSVGPPTGERHAGRATERPQCGERGAKRYVAAVPRASPYREERPPQGRHLWNSPRWSLRPPRYARTAGVLSIRALNRKELCRNFAAITLFVTFLWSESYTCAFAVEADWAALYNAGRASKFANKNNEICAWEPEDRWVEIRASPIGRPTKSRS